MKASTQACPTPFGFDRVFRFAAPEPPAASQADLHVQIVALEAEIERLGAERDAMLARARADGFEAGLAQARRERDAALLATTRVIHASIADAEALVSQRMETAIRDAAEVALAAAEALAGHAIDHAPARAIEEALASVLRHIPREARIAIRVHPDLTAQVERIVAGHADEPRGLTFAVVGDEAVAPNDAQLSWEAGGLVLDAAARRQTVMAELGTLLAAGGQS